MTEFKRGDRVRINEGELEGIEGFVMVAGPHVTSVKLNLMTGETLMPVYTEMLVSADEPHPALEKMLTLYPDFLKSDKYRYRLTTYVNGVTYTSAPLSTGVLKETLAKPPAGLERLEFMIKEDNPSRGLAWKLLWSD